MIQRFGSALNLNIHFHMLFLDGVYAEDKYGLMRFHRVKAPTIEELNALVHQISHRVTRFLKKNGCNVTMKTLTYCWIPLTRRVTPSVSCRGIPLHTGLRWGRRKDARCSPCKAFRTAWIPPENQTVRLSKQAFPYMQAWRPNPTSATCWKGCAATFPDLQCRKKQLALTGNGKVRYELKTPYRDGTTPVFFKPLDFIAQLAALAWRAAFETAREPDPAS